MLLYSEIIQQHFDISLEVRMGPLVENIHRGDIAVVGTDGKIEYCSRKGCGEV